MILINKFDVIFCAREIWRVGQETSLKTSNFDMTEHKKKELRAYTYVSYVLNQDRSKS